MFVVFGWLKESRPVRDALKCYCYVCQRARTWELWRETEWVTLFGQRTLPFLSKHSLVCSMCSDDTPISNALARSLGSTGIEASSERLIHQKQLSGKSELQRRFLESVRTTNSVVRDAPEQPVP
jgi:hypothetical protein